MKRSEPVRHEFKFVILLPLLLISVRLDLVSGKELLSFCGSIVKPPMEEIIRSGFPVREEFTDNIFDAEILFSYFY